MVEDIINKKRSLANQSYFKRTISIRSLREAVKAEADPHFCLIDGEEGFPRDECIECPAYEFCMDWLADYLVAKDRIFSVEEGRIIVK